MRRLQCFGVQITSIPVHVLFQRHSRSSEPEKLKPASQAKEQFWSVTWSLVHEMEPFCGASS